MGKIIVFLAILAVPASALASVVINEIAWMGTANSAQDEWLELYSVSGANLDGWILKTGDGGMTINLSGTISAGGYFLIERTDDTTVPDVAADLITPFGSGLNNSGEVLILLNASGGEEDRVDASAGWTAGDNTSKDTMQKSGSGWVSAPGTPKTQNASTGSTPPSQPATVPPSPPPSSEPGQNSSPPNYASEDDTKKISAQIIALDAGIAGAEFYFEGKAFGLDQKEIVAQRYAWSFGDGGFANGRKVSHTYRFPGIYQVSLSIISGEFSASAYDSIDIVPSELSISEVKPGLSSWMEIRNRSSKRVELTGWMVESAGKNFAFPSSTFMAPNSFLVLTEEISGIRLADSGEVSLLYPSGQKADSFSYGGTLSAGQSFTRIGAAVKMTIATPGKEEGKIVSLPPAPPKIQNVPPAPAPSAESPKDIQADPPDYEVVGGQSAQVSQPFLSKSSIIWFLSALGVGVLSALGYLISKRPPIT